MFLRKQNDLSPTVVSQNNPLKGFLVVFQHFQQKWMKIKKGPVWFWIKTTALNTFLVCLVPLVVCVLAVDDFTRPSHVSTIPLWHSEWRGSCYSVSPCPRHLWVSVYYCFVEEAGAVHMFLRSHYTCNPENISCTNILVTRTLSYLHRSLGSSRALAN